MNILYLASESKPWVIDITNEIAKQGHNVYTFVYNYADYDSEKEISKRNMVYYLPQFFSPKDAMNEREHLNYFVDYIMQYFDRKNGPKFNCIFSSYIDMCDIALRISEKYDCPKYIMIHDIPKIDIENVDWRKSLWEHYHQNLKFFNGVIFTHPYSVQIYEHMFGINFNYQQVFYPIQVPDLTKVSKCLENGKPVISSSHRLNWKKGTKLVLHVLKDVKIPYSYKIIGRDDGDLSYLQNYSDVNNLNVEFLGMVDNLTKWDVIYNSKCLIYPNIDVLMGGLSPLEALYLGTPAICSYTKCHELIYRDRVNYYHDLPELKNLIEKALNNQLRIPDSSDKEYIEANFTPKAFVNSLIKYGIF